MRRFAMPAGSDRRSLGQPGEYSRIRFPEDIIVSASRAARRIRAEGSVHLAARVAAIVTVALTPALIVTAPAQAATAVNGATCTIVGTSGADHLYGRAGRDVI